VDIKAKIKTEIVLALGYFDSVHFGHRKIISSAVEYAKNHNYSCMVFTFSNDLCGFFGEQVGQVYTYIERKEKILSLGVDKVIAFEFNEQFKSLTKIEFLDLLNEDYDIKKIFCGYDYKFGKNSEGNINTLKEYFGSEKVEVFSKIELKNKRVSTTIIKELLLSGNMTEANYFLVEPFSITGKIVSGRGEGHIYGFPTANLMLPASKILPKRDVYATIMIIDGKRYRAVTNVGSKPTFNVKEDSIESFLINFNDNIYNKEVKLEFYSYLRDTKGFSTPQKLKEQIFLDATKSEELC